MLDDLGLCCRALRVVNPSPYMIYLQARGSILVASSPEILCHVSEDRTVTNRSTMQLPPGLTDRRLERLSYP